MQRPLHPLHAALLAGTVPLFLGALLADIAYFRSHDVEWKNFASWLIVGGLAFGAGALLWALLDVLRVPAGGPRPVLGPVLLLAVGVLGFINALVHAADAWASMPAGLILSAVVGLLAMVATGVGFSRRHPGGAT